MPLRGDSSLECKEARELTRGFLSGGGVLERRAEWRAHLAACKECDEQYRETVEMLSRLHRARTDPVAGVPERAAEAESAALPERRSLIAFSPPRTRVAWRPRKRLGWLKIAIPFLALLVFGAIGLPGSAAHPASALALYGAVEVDEHMIAPGDPARPLARGSKIVAAASARVRLQDAQTELVLEGEGALCCEGFGPLRVHLYGGRLQAQGACTVSSALGIVQSAGGALELRIEEDGLHVRAGASGASFQDGGGRRALAPLEELQVGPR
jgi:hypothetical protein